MTKRIGPPCTIQSINFLPSEHLHQFQVAIMTKSSENADLALQSRKSGNFYLSRVNFAEMTHCSLVVVLWHTVGKPSLFR